MINPYLFVYGTLLSAAGHPMGAKLAGAARLIGPASIQGRLYRIAWYPGVVDSPDLGQRVWGELYLLADPRAALAWLDHYEGVEPGREPVEYLRVERPVKPATGPEVTAWVYLYLRDAADLTPIVGGRWIGSGK